MKSVYFGIIIGLFLYFAGQRFLVVAIKAWKERKVNEDKKTEKKLEMMVDKVMGKIKNKKE